MLWNLDKKHSSAFLIWNLQFSTYIYYIMFVVYSASFFFQQIQLLFTYMQLLLFLMIVVI